MAKKVAIIPDKSSEPLNEKWCEIFGSKGLLFLAIIRNALIPAKT